MMFPANHKVGDSAHVAGHNAIEAALNDLDSATTLAGTRLDQTKRLLPVATNGWAAGSMNNMSAVAGTSRQPFWAAYDCADIRLVYGNSYVDGNDTLGAAVITVRAAVEWGSQIQPVTFGGKRDGTVDPGGMLVSDPIGVEFAAGAKFYIRTYHSSASAPKATSASYGTAVGGFTATTDLTALGSAAVTASVAWLFGPRAIVGTPTPVSAPAVLIVGDSIAAGYGDSSTPTSGAWSEFDILAGQAGGFVARGIARSRPWINVAVPGEWGQGFAGGQLRRAAYAGFCTHAVVNYGRNDINGGLDAATVCGVLLSVWRRMSRRGLKTFQTTITPQTTSTDSWATAGNQTVADAGKEAVRVAVNTWLRDGAPMTVAGAVAATGTPGVLRAGDSGHYLTGVFEAADLAETARNSGRWKPGFTADGIHPNPAGAAGLAPAIDVSVLT